MTQAFYGYTTAALDQATTTRTGENFSVSPERGNQKLLFKSSLWAGVFSTEMSKCSIERKLNLKFCSELHHSTTSAVATSGADATATQSTPSVTTPVAKTPVNCQRKTSGPDLPLLRFQRRGRSQGAGIQQPGRRLSFQVGSHVIKAEIRGLNKA